MTSCEKKTGQEARENHILDPNFTVAGWKETEGGWARKYITWSYAI
jgi:hypothetical protein